MSIDFKNCFLDMKMLPHDSEDKNRVCNWYNDMLQASSNGSLTHATSLYHTLTSAGYLKCYKEVDKSSMING
jgi:hypothetical protein